MTEREQIVNEIADAIIDSMDGELVFPRSYARIMADAALRVIEAPKPLYSETILPCTCDHNGYGKHREGCALS